MPRVLQSETVLSSTLQWANPSDPPSSLAAETGGRRRTATQIFSIGFQILNSNGGKISGENGRIVCLCSSYDLGPLFGPISSKRRQRSNKPWPNINRMGHLDDLVIRPMARECLKFNIILFPSLIFNVFSLWKIKTPVIFFLQREMGIFL